MSWIIVYTDGAYESNRGSGFPVALIEEAGKFSSKEEAEEHAIPLMDVMEIKEI